MVANMLKGGVVVLILLAALAAFDVYDSYVYNITGTVIGVDYCPLDLAHYPCQFVKDGKWNAIIVVGDKPDRAVDGAVSIVGLGLQRSGRIKASAAVRASRVGNAFGQNVISVGHGCANLETYKIQERFGKVKQCLNSAVTKDGKGVITLYDFGNGKIGLVVEGYTSEDAKMAAKLLQGYKDWQAAGQLKGKSVVVVKNSAGRMSIASSR